MEKNRFEDESKLLLEDEARPKKKGMGRWILLILILGGLSYGGYRWWTVAKLAAADATQQTDNPGGGGGRGRGGRGRGGEIGRAHV